MGFLSSLANTAGDLVYSALGGKASAKQQYTYQKEYMQNAHQWEVNDLKSAGLNPVLSAGGSGATGTATGGSMSSGLGVTDAISNMTNSAINAYKSLKDTENQTKLVNAQADNLETSSAKNIEETKAIPQYLKNDTSYKTAQINGMKLEQKFLDESYQTRLTKLMSETEQEVSKGRISIDNAKFLQDYGITKEQAIQLGESGIREIFGLIKAGVGVTMVNKKANEIIKTQQRLSHSAKQQPTFTPIPGHLYPY